MTAIEFVAKNLHKSRIKLEKAKQKPNVSTDETAILEEQIEHYEYIGELLTADVVEVVRCKDCEFIKGTQISINKRPLRSCTLYKKPCYDDDFCSRGVRKGENDV